MFEKNSLSLYLNLSFLCTMNYAFFKIKNILLFTFRFFMFTKPVDVNEVPDYLNIIKTPMDLETMMTNIDLHHYNSAQEFLSDIDLIVRNALEYNPER